MSKIENFKDLLIWQKGIDIAEKCYFLTKTFPTHLIPTPYSLLLYL